MDLATTQNTFELESIHSSNHVATSIQMTDNQHLKFVLTFVYNK